MTDLHLLAVVTDRTDVLGQLLAGPSLDALAFCFRVRCNNFLSLAFFSSSASAARLLYSRAVARARLAEVFALLISSRMAS